MFLFNSFPYIKFDWRRFKSYIDWDEFERIAEERYENAPALLAAGTEEAMLARWRTPEVLTQEHELHVQKGVIPMRINLGVAGVGIIVLMLNAFGGIDDLLGDLILYLVIGVQTVVGVPFFTSLARQKVLIDARELRQNTDHRIRMRMLGQD